MDHHYIKKPADSYLSNSNKNRIRVEILLPVLFPPQTFFCFIQYSLYKLFNAMSSTKYFPHLRFFWDQKQDGK